MNNWKQKLLDDDEEVYARALAAGEKGTATFQKWDVSCAGTVMHYDKDPVYTGYGWRSALLREDKLLIMKLTTNRKLVNILDIDDDPQRILFLKANRLVRTEVTYDSEVVLLLVEAKKVKEIYPYRAEAIDEAENFSVKDLAEEVAKWYGRTT